VITVARDADLQRSNTLALPSRADRLVIARQVDEIREVVSLCGERGWRIEVLGEGSNVVLRDRLPGCVVRPDLRWVHAEEQGERVYVHAGAGVHWHELVRWCIGLGFFGLENLALIPGTVGAAPIQNIGAYGVEMESRFDHLLAVSTRDARLERLGRDACGFGYRDSVFKRDGEARFVIVEVTFLLSRTFRPVTDYPDVREELARLGGPLSAARVADAVIRVRRRKLPDPRHVPNAGSFFKNPTVTEARFRALSARLPGLQGFPVGDGRKISAARLIDACGWKGRRAGGVGVWWRQPLVLVNLGGARGQDVLAFAEAIADDVGDRFGVELEHEPRILGEDHAAG
jgi:UDP-N-acetylmuramate dehydrogenase